MAYSTSDKILLTTDWTNVANGFANVTVQATGAEDVMVVTDTTAPTTFKGLRLRNVDGERSFSVTGLTTEAVYVRAASSTSSVTVVKG